MSVVIVTRGFSLPPATLSSVAERLLGALQDETIGAPVVSRMSPAFVADFSAQIALVAKLGTDQTGAIGSVGSLVQSLAEARAEVLHLVSAARRVARLTFPGQTTLLRGEFLLGAATPRDLPLVIDRGRKLLAAVQRSAPALEAHGWFSSSTEALHAAVEGLASLSLQREDASDGKIGLTAERIVATNRLYRQCLGVQNVARMVYSGLQGSADPASVEARARFLLGEFPRRVVPAPVAVPPTTPVAPVPAPHVAAA